MKKPLYFPKHKGKNHPDANQPSETLFDEVVLNNLIQYKEISNESYDSERIYLGYDDEWMCCKVQIKVPEHLSKSITKDAIKKFGI